jgi:pimeloyl-ACP methyl ester carboxylesterase
MCWAGLAILVTAVAILATGAIYAHVGILRDARRLSPPGQLIDVGGRVLHLHCLGNGPLSVVFESGLAASSLNWRPVQHEVARFARACAYDRAGYGWSDRASGPRTARASAADLHRLLHAAGVPPPYVLVAHSFGTYIAVLFAAEHAQELAGLILVDPITADEWLAPDRVQRRLLIGGRLLSCIGAGLASIGVVRFLLNRTRPGGSALPGAVLALFGRQADAVVRRVVGEVTKMPRELWPAVRAHWSRARGFLTMAQHFRGLPQSAAEVKTGLAPAPDKACLLCQTPIVVISAANCSEDRIRRHRVLADLSLCGSHVRATAGGHWVHLDEAAVVIDAIRGLAHMRMHEESSG